MRLLTTFLLLTVLISCNRTLELKTNPFDPNYNTTVDNLKQWEFEVTTIDDGFCIYKKSLTDKSEMYFYLDFKDDCFKTTGQGIIFKLDTLGYHVTFDELVDNGYDKWFIQNRQEFQKDSLQIIDILKTYNGIKISNIERLGSSENIIFNVKPTDSNDIYECVYTAYPQNQKTLTFEKTWSNEHGKD